MTKTIAKLISAITISACAVSAQAAPAESLFSHETNPQEWCLAQNIYFEARGSSFADQVAVADVVLNRVESNKFPNTICDVVQQNKYPGKRNTCQFSWYCDGKSDWPTDKDAWANAQYIAYSMIHYEDFKGITEGADHYHADYVKPSWSKSMTLTGTIGSHKYYRSY